MLFWQQDGRQEREREREGVRNLTCMRCVQKIFIHPICMDSTLNVKVCTITHLYFNICHIIQNEIDVRKIKSLKPNKQNSI